LSEVMNELYKKDLNIYQILMLATHIEMTEAYYYDEGLRMGF